MPLRDEPVRSSYATPSPAEKHIHPAPMREHANSDSSTLSQIKTHEYNTQHDITPSTVQHGHNLFHTPQRMSTQSRHLTKLQSLRDRLGLTPEAPLDDQALVHDEDGKELWWPHIRYLLREPFAEFWGTFAWNDVKARYRRSRIGQFWITISVGLFVLGVGLVYSGIFGIPMAQYMPRVAVAYVVWTFGPTTMTTLPRLSTVMLKPPRT